MNALKTLQAWACEDTPFPTLDPLDRLVIVENERCLQRLKQLLGRAERSQRQLRVALAVPPQLLPPA
ncbi:MAG: hypothetical protein KDK04_25170 [Candidatus Competibacteraceae bacterium]|nr:hypothetical protein [Candidatus Competibacteraceae bacterium]MCB1814981.1 hypothetical protein [Candidatus Competibacteraceae bacterium]